MATGERPPLKAKARDAVGEQLGRRLDSWKEIASWFERSEKTVRRWEQREGMPVHRLLHEKRGTVYAYSGELEAWRQSRNGKASEEASAEDQRQEDGLSDPVEWGEHSSDVKVPYVPHSPNGQEIAG